MAENDQGNPQPQQPQYAPPTQQPQYQQFPPPQFQQFPPPQVQQQPAAPKGGGTIWVGLISLIAGIASLIFSLIPGEFAFRVVVSVIGILLAVLGLVLAIIGLRKKLGTGFSVAGLIVSGLGLLFGVGFLALGLFATYQIDQTAKRVEEERQQLIDEQQAEEDAVLEQSQWIEDARAAANAADFVEVDAETLTAILADPESYQDQGIIVSASMGEPLIFDVLTSQGVCLTRVSVAPTADASSEFSNRAAILDRGTEDECPLTNTMLGIGGEGSVAENLSTSYRMWLTPAGMIPGPENEDMPSFLLIKIED